MTDTLRRIVNTGGLAVLLGGTPLSLSAQKPLPPAEPLLTAALAGMSVLVVPASMVLNESGVTDSLFPDSRPLLLRWTDSLLAEAISERAPEVNWVMPPELRRIARRAPGIAPDPDQMGQAIMRQRSLKTVPDPLRSYLRNLMAIAGGGRHAFIPAALVFTDAPDGTEVQAHLSAALVDGRSGQVLWRTESVASGATPATALKSAIAAIFPIF